MSPFERREFVFRARRCFNCLGSHLVVDRALKCDCRKFEGSKVGKPFYVLHDSFVSTILKDVHIAMDKNKTSGGEKARLSLRSVRVRSTKTALNGIVATRVLNPRN